MTSRGLGLALIWCAGGKAESWCPWEQPDPLFMVSEANTYGRKGGLVRWGVVTCLCAVGWKSGERSAQVARDWGADQAPFLPGVPESQELRRNQDFR